MSQCNYCTYRNMLKKGYRKATTEERKHLWDNETDKTTPEFHNTFGPGVVIVDQNGKFVAWLMELPNHCCC